MINNKDYLSYDRAINALRGVVKAAEKTGTSGNICPYCGDGMEPKARFDMENKVWEAMYACTNVECGATSPRKWATKRKKALAGIEGKTFKIRQSNTDNKDAWKVTYKTGDITWTDIARWTP